MKLMQRVGKWWVELDHEPPVECDRRLIVWLGVMLAVLNILIAYAVIR